MSQGHIRPQGDGSWEIKFDMGRDPLSGRRITKYVTFRGTKRKAQEELTRLLGQRNDGSYIEPTKMTVAQYLHHWLEADIERRVAARTAARYRGIVEKNIIPKLGHVPVRKLTAVHIEAFEAELQREGWVKARAKQKIKKDEAAPLPEKRGLSAQTALHVHRVLSQALGHAVRLGVLFKNPARQVKPPRPSSREIKILDKNEIAGLIKEAKKVGLYVPVLVAVTTGMRRGELLALRWSDIDLKAASLTVNQSLERIKGKFEFKSPKTKTSRRTITLPAITVEALRRHYKVQLEERLKLGLGRNPRGLVFARPDSQPMDADTLSKAFRRLVASAKVTPITFHGLRHTHISHLLMEGVHAKVVSERAGHAHVNITLGVYAAYMPSMQADAALRVDAWLR
ncbi:MAG TPA: site-specific integrase [Xanthobacteraceae bacterium]|nr:site-specific integrase [Xanthobacteraceae bacterium]